MLNHYRDQYEHAWSKKSKDCGKDEGDLGWYVIIYILDLSCFNNANEEDAEKNIPHIESQLSTHMRGYIVTT